MEMEMEIEGENGSKILVEEKMDLGRGLGFDSTDRTVSRRHVSFKKLNQTQTLCFQVIGKNPIWVRTNNEIIRVYKSTQQGELKAGDSFCVSSKNPLWFHLKGIACQPQIHLNNQIDPVKEFSFVVMGHEFDSYPTPRHIRNWNWFLQQPSNEDSDDIKSRKKRKKGGKKDNDDDVWTGESEDDVEVLKKKLRNDPKPKYSTRSKDKNKNNRNGATKSAKDDAKSDDDDEGDDTLGGFLVDDEDIGEGNEEDDEEEEFEEDVDEDDDDDDDD